MNSVRAKFRCVSITLSEGGLKTVTLQPVTSGSDENKEFFKWTPSGQISLGVLNPAASSQFELGAEYLVDFTKAG